MAYGSFSFFTSASTFLFLGRLIIAIWQVLGNTSSWCWFVFPWYLVVLIIFHVFVALVFLLLLLLPPPPPSPPHLSSFSSFSNFFLMRKASYYLSKWKRGLLATGGCCKEGMTRRNGGNGVLYDPSQEGAPSESLKGQKEKKDSFAVGRNVCHFVQTKGHQKGVTGGFLLPSWWVANNSVTLSLTVTQKWR